MVIIEAPIVINEATAIIIAIVTVIITILHQELQHLRCP